MKRQFRGRGFRFYSQWFHFHVEECWRNATCLESTSIDGRSGIHQQWREAQSAPLYSNAGQIIKYIQYRIQALWCLSNFLMVHEGFLCRLSPEIYFLINWFPITKYGVSISFSQQAFPLGASLHCRQSDERNTFSNEQSKARTSGVREQIYFRMCTESTNDASE